LRYTAALRDGTWLNPRLSENSNSGIYVTEGPARGQPILVGGEPITAFVGPAPRGPVDHAVYISAAKDFQHIFGLPECHCRMEFAVRQFFANGGSNAVIVRVTGTTERNRIQLPGKSGELVLEARNPGPLEYLRASVDYDGLQSGDESTADQTTSDGQQSFNLIVQRLRGAGSAWIDAQECYRNVSVNQGHRDYIGYVLAQSELVQLVGKPPSARPSPTIKPTTMRQAGYVDAVTPSGISLPPGDYDLIGSATAGTGLNALAHTPDIGQICLISGAEGAALGPVAMLAADQFCRDHQALLIIDPPARWKSVDDVVQDQERSGFSSPNAVTWYPPVRTRTNQGEGITTSIVGAVAAALNADSKMTGVHQLHAEGPVMQRGGVRLTARLNDHDLHRLARAGINGLIQRSALHLQLIGNSTQARYGSIASEWSELDLRRQVLFILRRIRQGTRWTFFHSSTAEVWDEVEKQVGEFLTELHARSILAGEHAARSFFVRCDSDTNAGLEGHAGEIAFVVGFALRNSGEMLAFRLHRAGGQFRISELGWQSGFARAS
jgi:hypothetical protein